MWQVKRTLVIVIIILFLMNIFSFCLGRITAEEKIDLNTATFEELNSLRGIGDIKAQEIISNRPYCSICDLLELNIVGDTTFNIIKEDITVYD